MTGTLLLHSKIISELKIKYTIENKRIKIKNLDEADDKEKAVTLYDDRLPGIGFLHIKACGRRKIHSVFDAASAAGIILSLQVISENHRFEFQSQNSLSANYSPAVESAQIISASTSFSHNYENAGKVNRLDIFISSEKIASLLPQNLSDKVDQEYVLNLPLQDIEFSSSLSEIMNILIEKLEEPQGKSFYTFFEKFIQSLTH